VFAACQWALYIHLESFFLQKKAASHSGKEVMETQKAPPGSHLKNCLEPTLIYSINNKKANEEMTNETHTKKE
jgi:hypothetical protein